MRARTPVNQASRSGYEFAHSFSRFRLHSGHNVGVLAESESRAFVSEAFADDLDRHVGSECQRGVRMPQVMIMPTSA